MIDRVDVAGDQVSRFSVGACDHERGRAHHVGRQARRRQLGHRLARGHKHLAAHVAAFFHRSQLVFEVHARRTRLDHRLHQLEGVQHAAETGFGVGDDGREEVDVVLAFRPLNLVGALERVVDALDHHRHRVDGVERLVGVHLAGRVRVTRHLPARQVDRLQAGLDLLHRLVAGQRAERVDERLGVDQRPELFGTALGDGVFDRERTTQPNHIGGAVAALHAFPARVARPVLLQGGDLLFTGQLGHVEAPRG